MLQIPLHCVGGVLRRYARPPEPQRRLSPARMGIDAAHMSCIAQVQRGPGSIRTAPSAEMKSAYIRRIVRFAVIACHCGWRGDHAGGQCGLAAAPIGVICGAVRAQADGLREVIECGTAAPLLLSCRAGVILPAMQADKLCAM